MKIKTAENEAIARAFGLPISTKMSIEICDNIRGKNVDKSIVLLEDVQILKRAIKIRKFDMDLGHKAGKMGPARYPVNAAKYFVQVLKLAKSNAENKGLNSENLIISFAKADNGPKRWHYGRRTRERMKSTHLEIHLKESDVKKKQEKPAKKKETKQ